jgi:peroxiredoxin
MTLVAVLLGSAWIGMTTVKASALNTVGKPARAELGYPAPDFTLDSPTGGRVTLSDFKGKPVVLNFWATWCPPCRQETPAFVAAYRQWQGEIAIIGVNVQENAGLVLPFTSEYGVKYPIALDVDAEVARVYHVVSFPTTYFIDSQGVVTKIDTGPLNEALLQTRLADLAGR